MVNFDYMSRIEDLEEELRELKAKNDYLVKQLKQTGGKANGKTK